MPKLPLRPPTQPLVLATLAIAVSAIGGCAAPRSPLDLEVPGRVWVVFPDRSSYRTENGSLRPLSLLIDGKPDNLPVVGRHRIEAKVRWSNDFVETVALDATLAARHWYRAFAFEISPGADPATAVVRTRTTNETLGDAVLGGLGTAVMFGVAPVAVPGILITAPWWMAADKSPAPTTRPVAGCCFVWLEDPSSEDIVAGSSPWGAVQRLGP